MVARKDSRPPRFDVPLLVAICFITSGLCIPIWFLKRRRWLNSLAKRHRLSADLPGAILLLDVIWIAMLIVSLVASDTISVQLDQAMLACAALNSGLVLRAAFKARAMINWHYNITRQTDIYVSGTATFFFHVFYLQYVINRLPAPDPTRVE